MGPARAGPTPAWPLLVVACLVLALELLDFSSTFLALLGSQSPFSLGRRPAQRVVQILQGLTLRALILHVEPRTGSTHHDDEAADGKPVPPTCGACCRTGLSPHGLHEPDPTEPRV